MEMSKSVPNFNFTNVFQACRRQSSMYQGLKFEVIKAVPGRSKKFDGCLLFFCRIDEIMKLPLILCRL